MEKYWNILEKCANIAKEREESYGDVLYMLDKWEDIHRNIFGNINREKLIEGMISLKLTREANQHKEDNLIDLINYIAILSFIKDNNQQEDIKINDTILK